MTDRHILTVDPSTGAELARYDAMTFAQVEETLAAAHAAAADWARVAPAERAKRLIALAATLRAQAEPLAALATAEMGKPLSSPAARWRSRR